LDHRSSGYGRSGRIILLGDGTEVLTDADDAEMFDHSEEDKDAENQVNKDNSDTSDDDSNRHRREGTPGPQSTSNDSQTPSKEAGSSHQDASRGPGTTIKGVADNA